jgi:hypothetical protein
MVYSRSCSSCLIQAALQLLGCDVFVGIRFL